MINAEKTCLLGIDSPFLFFSIIGLKSYIVYGRSLLINLLTMLTRIKLMAVTATNLASPLFFSSKRIIMPTTYAIYTIFVAMELIN